MPLLVACFTAARFLLGDFSRNCIPSEFTPTSESICHVFERGSFGLCDRAPRKQKKTRVAKRSVPGLGWDVSRVPLPNCKARGVISETSVKRRRRSLMSQNTCCSCRSRIRMRRTMRCHVLHLVLVLLSSLWMHRVPNVELSCRSEGPSTPSRL